MLQTQPRRATARLCFMQLIEMFFTLAIAIAGILQEQQVQQVEVWVAMCTGSYFCYIAARDLKQPGVENVQSSTTISCLYRMRYQTACVLLHLERQEDCIHSLEELPSHHRYLPQHAATSASPITEVTRRVLMRPGSNCLHRRSSI